MRTLLSVRDIKGKSHPRRPRPDPTVPPFSLYPKPPYIPRTARKPRPVTRSLWSCSGFGSESRPPGRGRNQPGQGPVSQRPDKPRLFTPRTPPLSINAGNVSKIYLRSCGETSEEQQNASFSKLHSRKRLHTRTCLSAFGNRYKDESTSARPISVLPRPSASQLDPSNWGRREACSGAHGKEQQQIWTQAFSQDQERARG